MDWFRWHHGSVNDPKFKLVARNAGATVAEVVALWACLLEAASTAIERGHPGNPDFASLDCCLDILEGRSESIYTHMQARGLIDQVGRIAAWEKRQRRREREDDSPERVAKRVAKCREKKRHVTPCNAATSQETPRGEEIREEEKEQKRPPSEDSHNVTSSSFADESEGVLEGHECGDIAPAVTLYGRAAVALIKAGIRCTSQNPNLIAAVDAGVTVDHLVELAALHPGKPVKYLCTIARSELTEPAGTVLPNARGGPSRQFMAIQNLLGNNLTAVEAPHEHPNVVYERDQ